MTLVALLSACGAAVRPTPSTATAPSDAPTVAGPSPACPHLMAWPPYQGIGVPPGLTVTRTGPTSVRISNTTAQEWTVRGEWWPWQMCWGVARDPSANDPVSLLAGSSEDRTIRHDPGLDLPLPLQAPTRVGVAFWDHPCTAETCQDQPTGFWWAEIGSPSPSK